MTRIWMAAAGAITCAVMAGCGSASAEGTPRTAPTPTATVGLTPTPSGPGVGMYPAVDTPVTSAPAAMALAWEQLGIVKTIPGGDILSKAPAMPAVANHTGGALTTATASAVETAMWRESTLIQWAEAHGEGGFIAQNLLGSQEAAFLGSATLAALDAHGTVVDPNCDLFPTSVGIWPHSSVVDSWLADDNFQTSAADVVTVPFNETNCRLTLTSNGTTKTETADPGYGLDQVLWVGEVVNDPVIGPYFKIEASADCTDTHAIPAMCKQ